MPPPVLTSFRNLLLRPCLSAKESADFHLVLLVLNSVVRTQILLLQSRPARNQEVRFHVRSGPNDDYIWFDTIKAIQVTAEAAHHGRNRPAPASARQDQRKTIPSSFETTTEPLAKNAATATASAADLTSDRGYNEDVESSSPSPKCTRRAYNLSGSNHAPHTSSDRLTNHNAFATASVSPPFKVADLDIFICTMRPVPLRLPNLLSNNALEHLSEEHISVL